MGGLLLKNVIIYITAFTAFVSCTISVSLLLRQNSNHDSCQAFKYIDPLYNGSGDIFDPDFYYQKNLVAIRPVLVFCYSVFGALLTIMLLIAPICRPTKYPNSYRAVTLFLLILGVSLSNLLLVTNISMYGVTIELDRRYNCVTIDVFNHSLVTAFAIMFMCACFFSCAYFLFYLLLETDISAYNASFMPTLLVNPGFDLETETDIVIVDTLQIQKNEGLDEDIL